jgi:hypothetical protein
MSFGQALERMDTDGDGRINREEFSGPKAGFDRMDADGDGIVTRREFESARGRMGAPPGRDANPGPLPLFELIDADGDGSLTSDDLSKFLKRLDVNQDDGVSRDEFMDALRRAMEARGAETARGERPAASRMENFSAAHPAPGEPAPGFELRDLSGHRVSLAELLQKGPVILEFGSFT